MHRIHLEEMRNDIKGQLSLFDMFSEFNSLDVCVEDFPIANEIDTVVQYENEFSIPDDIEQRMKCIKKFSLVDCEKCDCAFGSITCFKNRGYKFDCHIHFIKAENGKPLRRMVKLKCLKELAEDPPELKKGCWLSTRDFGNNSMCATEECNGGNDCRSCGRYIGFYGYVEELQEKNRITFSEAIKIAPVDGYDRR